MTDIGETTNKAYEEQQTKAGNKESDLEKKANGGFFKKIFDFAYMGLTTAAAYAVAGPLNLVSVTGTYLLAHTILNRKKITYKGFRKELHLGNAMTVVLYYLFKAFNAFYPGNFLLNTAFILGAGIPAFNAAFLSSRYMIYNYTPLKLLKDTLTLKIRKLPGKLKEMYKKEYVPTTKRTYIVSPAIIAARNLAPFKYQLALTSIARFFYRLALGKGGEDSYKTPATQPA